MWPARLETSLGAGPLLDTEDLPTKTVMVPLADGRVCLEVTPVPRPARGWDGGLASPPSRPACGVAVGFRGHADVLPKQRGKVTLVRAADLEADRTEGHICLSQ